MMVQLNQLVPEEEKTENRRKSFARNAVNTLGIQKKKKKKF